MAGAALLLVRVDVRRKLPQFGVPAGHHRVAIVNRRKLLDGSAEDARRGFIDARLPFAPKFFQAARPDEPGSHPKPGPAGARHHFAPAQSVTLKFFFFRHESSSNLRASNGRFRVELLLANWNCYFISWKGAIVHLFCNVNPATIAGSLGGCGKTQVGCHSERSEESLFGLSPVHREILRRKAPRMRI